jgi:hypothetical protein
VKNAQLRQKKLVVNLKMKKLATQLKRKPKKVAALRNKIYKDLLFSKSFLSLKN